MNNKILLALLGLVFLVNICFSATVYVNATNETSCGVPNYPAIQDALTAANDSDTIIVCQNGTEGWHLTDTVNVNKQVNLQGNESNVKIVMDSSDRNIFSVSVADANISNFLLTRDDYSDDAVAAVMVFSDNTGVFDNEFRKSYYGVWLLSSSNCIVENNLASDLKEDGFGFYVVDNDNSTLNNNTAETANTGVTGFYDNSNSENTFSNNKAYGVEYGFGIEGTVGDTISNNVVDDSGTGNLEVGFYLHSNSNNNLLEGNEVLNPSTSGYYLSVSPDNTLNSNSVTGSDSTGYFVEMSSGNTLSGNTALNVDENCVMALLSENLNISDNEVQNCGMVGYLFVSSNGAVLSGDTSRNSTTQYYFDTTTAVISNCNAYDTPADGYDLLSLNSNVSTGSFLNTDHSVLTFSNARDVFIKTLNYADAGVERTGCSDENKTCQLVTPDYDVVNITVASVDPYIDLGIRYDDALVGSHPLEKVAIAKWSAEGWELLGWNTSNEAENYVKLDGLDSFSVFGVVKFDDAVDDDDDDDYTGGTSSGSSGSSKDDLYVTYETKCPGNELHVTVEEKYGPKKAVTVVLSKSGTTVAEGVSDEDGNVVFVLSSSGTYTLTASKTRYYTETKTVDFTLCGEEDSSDDEDDVDDMGDDTDDSHPVDYDQNGTSIREQAESALADAQSAIDAAKNSGKDVSSAEAKLAEAQEKLDSGYYTDAKELAEEAKQLADAAAAPSSDDDSPEAENEDETQEEEEEIDLICWAGIVLVVLVILAVAVGYWYTTRQPEETLEDQVRKELEESESKPDEKPGEAEEQEPEDSKPKEKPKKKK